MKRITFYTTSSDRSPVQEHMDTLSDKQFAKIAWVMKLVREIDNVPSNYLKKLINTDGIWEIRAVVAGNTFRLLGFFCGQELIVLTNSFQKKSQKTPANEIKLAKKRKRDYLTRRS